MTKHLRTCLEAAVGATYRIEKELGGGGMGRVFLADEVRLGRRVVIKVLPPDMGAGVNVERFEREIQFAARLQHPHVVPLLTAGADGDLLYYVMPYIEGESLRARLAREGVLPVREALRILRDVLDALHHAHSHGIVHRDIKPDNVLLSGKHALVTDFGVAKAVSDSSGSQGTSVGMVLGTSPYMAPEQAAAAPDVDYRADIYAVGATAYEMLAGRPPFTGPNAQAVLAAQMTEVPPPITAYRETVPPTLDAIILRCLERDRADRWQRVDELERHLDALPKHGDGVITAAVEPATRVDQGTVARRAHPARVAALFAASSATALGLVYGAMIALGLPDWVFVSALVLSAIGFPITLVSGHRERERAMATLAGRRVATPTGIERHLTLRTAALGGGVAFAGLALVAGGHSTMRALGIGPAATLTSSGLIEERERLILAEFENRATDSTLGEIVTELLRVDISQSPAVVILEPGQIGEVLSRMQRDTASVLTADLAREIAEREGIKAYITGDLLPVGSGYVVSARLISTSDGSALVTARADAATADDLIQAVDELSGELRARIGESLRTVRADPPLDEVTTNSLEALRKYAQGVSIASSSGEYLRAIPVLEEAVALDPQFAMAYRALAAYLSNVDIEHRADSAITRAYQLRGRLTEPERYMVEALYAHMVGNDHQRAIDRYQTLLEKYPDMRGALDGLSFQYLDIGRWTGSEDATRRAIALGGASVATYDRLAISLVNQGRLDAADSALAEAAARLPDRPQFSLRQASIAALRRDYARARELALRLREQQRGDSRWQARIAVFLASLAELRGRRSEADRLLGPGTVVVMQPGSPSQSMDPSIAFAGRRLANDLWYALMWRALDTTLMAARIEDLWRRLPLRTRSDSLNFAEAWAIVGMRDRSRALVARPEGSGQDFVRARLAAIEGRGTDAAAIVLEWRGYALGCVMCGLAEAAVAWDRAGEADSAIAGYDRFLAASTMERLEEDIRWLPVALRRLGELHEARGDRQQAIQYYSQFIELWRDADPDLQPFVQYARDRVDAFEQGHPR